MEIYDRWGSLVFQSTDPEKTWDGRCRQTLCQAGVYLYVSEIEFSKDSFTSKEEKKGTITLIR